MTGVFREIVMTHDGEDYTITPNNKLLRGIEREVSLTDMISRIASGKPPLSEVAFVVAEFLRSAGAEVDEDQIYADIMDDMAENEGKGFIGLCKAIIEAVSPVDEPKTKKPQPRKGKKPKK